MTEESRTLLEAVIGATERCPGIELVIDSDVRPRKATVKELVEDAYRLATSLQHRNIGPGDVVAIQLPNWYEGAVAQLAAVLCGAVLLPIVQIYGVRELKYILADANAKILFIPGEWRGRYYPDMLGEIQEHFSLEVVVVADAQQPEGTHLFQDLISNSQVGYQRPGVRPDDVALIVYTSGTTGEPKGVEHTHNSLLNEVYSLEERRLRREGQVSLGVFPSGHMAGLLELLRLVIHGSASVMMDRWDPVRAAQLIDEYRITSSAGAPIHLAGLLDVKDGKPHTLNTLASFLVGGASVPPSVILRAQEAGIAAYRSYGMTEHPTITMGKPSDTVEQRAYTDGRLTPGTEIRILNELGAEVAAGGDGELTVRGPELFRGYHGTGIDASAFLADGWFATGDIGRVDAEGFVTITDRKKDIIVRAGENISSKEVEDILSTHERVAEVAAIGAPDARYGERVCVFVVTGDGGLLTLPEVQEHFRAAGAAREKTPERIVVVSSLPRTPIGKVLKSELRTLLHTDT